MRICNPEMSEKFKIIEPYLEFKDGRYTLSESAPEDMVKLEKEV